MSSAQDSGRGGAQQPASSSADSGYRSPGLRGVRSTSLFRAVNPELFIKPAMLLFER
uniref:Small integral membrane protein 8 n=1 Tax=Sinocyclocheilus rhinocerous TaxID=307959 RepID=A0A673G558_9TELE